MKALIVGASAGVGRALSELLAKRGYELMLVASDEMDLHAQAAHLNLIYNVKVKIVTVDGNNLAKSVATIKKAADAFGSFDSLFFPIGASRSNDHGTLSFDDTWHLFNVNLLIIVELITCFLPALIRANAGNIVGFGSVAAVRGRRVNVVYAAAKRGLESYFESLRHLTANTGVKIQFYRLGYIDTQQTFDKKLLLPKVTPYAVAKTVVSNLGKDQGTTHIPRFWSIIGRVISVLPWSLFKRFSF